MSFRPKSKSLWPVLAVLFVTACSTGAPSTPIDESDRTQGRSTSARSIYPQAFFERQPYHEFLPGESNWDAQHRHPAQWLGQEWDPSLWNKDWPVERVIHHLYELRVFDGQAMEDNMPVLVLGPTFYKISDLDRRRSVKLLVDQSKIFDRGFTLITLRDWYTKDVIGTYTEKGLYLK